MRKAHGQLVGHKVRRFVQFGLRRLKGILDFVVHGDKFFGISGDFHVALSEFHARASGAQIVCVEEFAGDMQLRAGGTLLDVLGKMKVTDGRLVLREARRAFPLANSRSPSRNRAWARS